MQPQNVIRILTTSSSKIRKYLKKKPMNSLSWIVAGVVIFPSGVSFMLMRDGLIITCDLSVVSPVLFTNCTHTAVSYNTLDVAGH